MTSQLTVMGVDRQEDYYHVRFRDAEEFDELATPDWARELAEAEVSGSDVRMGEDDTDGLVIQSVHVPVSLVDDEDDASRKALRVVTAVTEHEMYETQ